MRIAREHRSSLARSQPIQRIDNMRSPCPQLLDGITQVQSDRGQHLVVARAPKMNAAARSPDSFGQALFQRRLAIFIFQRDVPFAASVFLAEGGQAEADYVQIVGREEFLRMEHLDMSK